MDAITITRHDQDQKGEYRAHVASEKAVGRLTWVLRNGARVADHTLVPREIGGRGVAARLVEALIADARAQNFRIVPSCSYVAAQFDKHPDWADLLA